MNVVVLHYILKHTSNTIESRLFEVSYNPTRSNNIYQLLFIINKNCSFISFFNLEIVYQISKRKFDIYKINNQILRQLTFKRKDCLYVHETKILHVQKQKTVDNLHKP